MYKNKCGEISRNFHAYTLEISHNTCTAPNEPACKMPRRIGASKVWPTGTTTIRSSSRRFAHSNPHSPQPVSLNGSHCLIIKIKLKVSYGSVLLNDWLAYFLFFAKHELVNHIFKLLTSEIWFDGRILTLSAYVSGKLLSKRKPP